VPYTWYIEHGIHFAVTRVEVDYLESIRFDDTVDVLVWIAWVRGASMRIHYTLQVGDRRVAVAATEHASIDDQGRVRRIPKERRSALRALAPAATA
jgi:acyl-CoA thioesterase FadM